MKTPYILFSILGTLMCTLASAQHPFSYQGELMHTNSHTWLVNPNATKEECLSGTVFLTAKDALLAADSIQLTVIEEIFTQERPLTIYFTPWVYWLDNPDDPTIKRPMKGDAVPYGLKLQLSHTRLIGLSADPTHTILACNRGQTQGAVGNFTMLHLTGEDITFENLTLGNYCNIDLNYPLNPALNRGKRAQAIVQAQLAICQGDKIVARNCHFISRLNLCPLVGARRTFFDNCYFECTDDALCGTGVHLNCRFKLFSGKPFYSTQGTGAIFLNCQLHSLTHGTQYLVKVGSPVTMIDCQWNSERPYTIINWTQDPTDDLRSYQYNLTTNNSPLHIDRQRPHLTVDLTGKNALEAFRLRLPKHLFTPKATGDTIVYNLHNLLGGTDGWNPGNQPDFLKQYTPKAVGMILNERKVTLETGKEGVTLRAAKMRFGERPSFNQSHNDIEWIPTGNGNQCIALHPQADGSLHLVGENHGEEPQNAVVIAKDASGLEAACVVTIYPSQLPPPEFTQTPTLTRQGDTLTANYQLNLAGRPDCSIITWHRCNGSNGEEAIPVAVSQPNQPLTHYPLTAADHGYYIQATIAPKNPRSPVGRIAMITTGEPIKVHTQQIDSLYTDFKHFPTHRQEAIHPGFWTVDAHKPSDTRDYEWNINHLSAPWYYGNGVDGAAGISGLIQGTRGARLLYTPLSRTYGNMELTLHVAPCKSAGQGFGSATGQYMDIGIKMDTRLLNGYALRIIRTTKNDKAVDFQLMEYTNGEATPISNAVSSICYRTGCVIKIALKGNTLIATAINTRTLPALHHPDLVDNVSLSSTVKETPHGGISIQHTGSIGASATLLRELKVVWE